MCSEGVLETDTASIINSFYMQSLLNPNLSKCVDQISLVFSPEDAPRMTDQFMERLAKEYMEEMGIENTHTLLSGIIIRLIRTVISYSTGWITTARPYPTRTTGQNEKVCKQLKDKYELTYGKGKENVNVQKLKGAEQAKYEIYHAVKDILPKVKDWKQFGHTLNRQGIFIDYKYKG